MPDDDAHPLPERSLPEPADTLSFYEALHAASHEMLSAARIGDWDAVCRLEGACAVLIARLREAQKHRPLAAHEQGDRMRILRAIVANDAEIRRICEPLPSFLDARSFMVGDVSLALH